MKSWPDQLKYDPLPPLLASQNPAINYFTRRELLNQINLPPPDFANLPAVANLLRRQQSDGSWHYPADKGLSQANYHQLETYRNLGVLVDKYGFDRTSKVVRRAAAFLFTFQTLSGDFRGIYGTQYTPNYSAAIMETLVRAGYAGDNHILKGFEWLLANRQDDGGWAIPLRTRGLKMDAASLTADTVEADKSMPFSHLVTGIVLRAFAAHPDLRHLEEARKAGNLLVSKLMLKDNYPNDRGAALYWFKFTFPFWFTDLISALDSLSLLGFNPEEPQIHAALNWFRESQLPGGSWGLNILKQASDPDTALWLHLAICRVFKRFYGG